MLREGTRIRQGFEDAFIAGRCGEEVPGPADLEGKNTNEAGHYRLDH